MVKPGGRGFLRFFALSIRRFFLLYSCKRQSLGATHRRNESSGYAGHTGIDLYTRHVAPAVKISWLCLASWPPHRGRNLLTTNHSSGTMFQKRRLTNSGALGATLIRIDVSGFNAFHEGQLSDCLNLPAKKQRVADGAKILLDIAKESADWFPPLKSALGGVNALIKHHEVLVELVATAHN
jgi:hypothetical protein